MRLTTTKRIAATLLVGVSLTACSALDEIMEGEQVDYKSTVRGQPLTLPPDLSSSQINPQYSTHAGVASAAAYNQAVAKAQKNAQSGGVLAGTSDMQVMRSGDKRWLVIDRDPNRVYQDLIAFWSSEGFTINRENPAAGIIETDWAENRAKIRGNLLHRALGSIIEMVSDSGERERFTSRLERVNGKTEVHIRHERMEETQMGGRDGTTFKWLPVPEDQELNAIMLSRLMAFLGASRSDAQQAVKQAVVQQQSSVAHFVDGQAALALSMSTDNAYRRVGQALIGSGFTIDNADVNSGTYLVRYLDTDTGEKRKSSNVISRLWGDKGNLTPVPYIISVRGSGPQAVVTVHSQDGVMDNSDTARRILTVIRERL